MKTLKLQWILLEKLWFQAATQPTSDNEDDEVERDEHEFCLNHVILPRFLPAKKPGFADQVKLMNAMIDTILQTQHIPRKTIDFFRQFKRLHNATTPNESFSRELRDQLQSLAAGETFAMFVRRQNCTLLVQKLRTGMILSTFRGDMKNCDVYGYESDIEVSFLIHFFRSIQFEDD